MTPKIKDALQMKDSLNLSEVKRRLLDTTGPKVGSLSLTSVTIQQAVEGFRRAKM